MQRGFIQSSFLMAIIVIVILGGSAYITYEVAKSSQNASETTNATTTTDVQTAMSADSATEIKTETEEETDKSASEYFTSQLEHFKTKLEVSLAENGQKEIINDVYTLDLPNGNILYFGVPNDANWGAAPFCGSGGCDYNFYVGNDNANVKKISGFDSYSLDCETDEISVFHDVQLFGFPKLDAENHILRMYYHLNAYLGTEDVYHIADDGSPELIASYDHVCNDKIQALFISSKYPAQLTAFE